MGNVKINVAELLKNCPSGMELDCLTFDNVFFQELDWSTIFPIICYRINNGIKENMYLTEFGSHFSNDGAKCIIFPKGKTTWEGFVPPCQFKDGDIVAFDSKFGTQIFLFKEYMYDHNYAQCYMMLNGNGDIDFESRGYFVQRFAIKEEKEKLFKAIKEHGYKWNTETKTLEKLPKFKVGDRIIHKHSKSLGTIGLIDESFYHCAFSVIPICDQDNWELVPNKFNIDSFRPFDKVLMRSSNAREWVATFYSHYSNNKFYGCGMCCDQCIPYEGNEHLLGTTNDCDEFYKIS